ncbi:uncharacterized protein At2g27730, mitochondrial [Diospyros lotus]|uniref:uncharacterized protein At2g27730, mitochondrial n=1 Tax=Diospyros lotus TaxID=55363 RepID=UPI0022525CE0|nr:uncharacterized protein At2g27730, mitochondrial [Diospyros lotus]
MATRSTFGSVSRACRFMERTRSPAASSSGALRYFSDDKGRVLSEEERAAENVYIKKMEREKMEKMKRKAEKEKAEKEKAGKSAEEGQKS